MTCKRDQGLWDLARRQHGVVARRQLEPLGFSRRAVDWALETGRLHRTQWRAVYLVGRPDLTRLGRLMACVLAHGDRAVLSHRSAAALWGIYDHRGREVEISVPAVGRRTKRPGVTVHRRTLRRRDVTWQRGIPVTTPARTIIDMAAETRDRRRVERMIDRADAHNILKPDALRAAAGAAKRQPGAPLVCEVLDRATFVLTDSEAERLLLPIARRAGLGKVLTQHVVNGRRVDFYFPDRGLVVEIDGHRYHRTPTQQAEDLRRDQAHLAAGLKCCRFSAIQLVEDVEVEPVLRRLSGL